MTATRHEAVGVGGGFIDIGTLQYVYLIGRDGRMPNEELPGRTLILDTGWNLDLDPEAYLERKAVIDRMVVSLEVVPRMKLSVLAAVGGGALALLGLVMAQVDGDTDIVPCFAGLTVAAVAQAVLVADPSVRWRRMAAFGVAFVWLVAAVWIGGLLLMFKVVCSCSMPFPIEPERTYLGVTATIYHLVGLYGGLMLASLAAWAAGRSQIRAA